MTYEEIAELKRQNKVMSDQIGELANFLFENGTETIGSHGGAIGEAIFQIKNLQKGAQWLLAQFTDEQLAVVNEKLKAIHSEQGAV